MLMSSASKLRPGNATVEFRSDRLPRPSLPSSLPSSFELRLMIYDGPSHRLRQSQMRNIDKRGRGTPQYGQVGPAPWPSSEAAAWSTRSSVEIEYVARSHPRSIETLRPHFDVPTSRDKNTSSPLPTLQRGWKWCETISSLLFHRHVGDGLKAKVPAGEQPAEVLRNCWGALPAARCS